MRTTIDRAGRLVVPKKLRDRLFEPNGGEVEILERDGVLEIRPVPASVVLEPVEGGLVARSVETLPPLSDADVRAAIDATRR